MRNRLHQQWVGDRQQSSVVQAQQNSTAHSSISSARQPLLDSPRVIALVWYSEVAVHVHAAARRVVTRHTLRGSLVLRTQHTPLARKIHLLPFQTALTFPSLLPQGTRDPSHSLCCTCNTPKTAPGTYATKSAGVREQKGAQFNSASVQRTWARQYAC